MIEFAFLLFVQFRRLNQLRDQITDVFPIGVDLVLVVFNSEQQRIELVASRFQLALKDLQTTGSNGSMCRMKKKTEDHDRQMGVVRGRRFLQHVLEKNLLFPVSIGHGKIMFSQKSHQFIGRRKLLSDQKVNQ